MSLSANSTPAGGGGGAGGTGLAHHFAPGLGHMSDPCAVRRDGHPTPDPSPGPSDGSAKNSSTANFGQRSRGAVLSCSRCRHDMPHAAHASSYAALAHRVSRPHTLPSMGAQRSHMRLHPGYTGYVA
eukprot:scaffold3644_cov107-Isochrysis_galbana.AAC.3